MRDEAACEGAPIRPDLSRKLAGNDYFICLAQADVSLLFAVTIDETVAWNRVGWA